MATYIKPEAIKDLSITKSKLDTALTNEINGKQEALTLTVKDNGNIVLANIQGQSKEFMPATPSGDPMHWAYITAGAEYNDTGADIVKDAPWADFVDDEAGKTVVHKAGYWYLNGLGDISNEEIRTIYSNINWYNGMDNCVGVCAEFKGRTIFPANQVGNILNRTLGKVDNFMSHSKIESANVELLVRNFNYGLYANTSLKYYYRIIDIAYCTNCSHCFDKDKLLKVIVIKNLKTSIDFQDSSNLTIKSILYMINNEAATSPITITLHADAYARAMADVEILAALETHTNVSLASA